MDWFVFDIGLFVGSSSALNLAATCQIACQFPENSVLVTVICDSGARHLSRFWNKEYITESGRGENARGQCLSWPEVGEIPRALRDFLEWMERVLLFLGWFLRVRYSLVDATQRFILYSSPLWVYQKKNGTHKVLCPELRVCPKGKITLEAPNSISW